jgi:hypothetical protein
MLIPWQPPILTWSGHSEADGSERSKSRSKLQCRSWVRTPHIDKTHVVHGRCSSSFPLLAARSAFPRPRCFCRPEHSRSLNTPFLVPFAMFTMLSRAVAAAVLVGPTLTNAFWILTHGSLTHDRLDPLLSPGKVSTHVHTVVGASNFAPITTFDTLQSSECTTSPVQADKR